MRWWWWKVKAFWLIGATLIALDWIFSQESEIIRPSLSQPANHQIAAKSVYLNLNRIMWQRPWSRDLNWLSVDLNILRRSIRAGAEIKLQMIWASWSFGSWGRGGNLQVNVSSAKTCIPLLLHPPPPPSTSTPSPSYLHPPPPHVLTRFSVLAQYL